MTTGDTFGRLRSWFLPELNAEFAAGGSGDVPAAIAAAPANRRKRGRPAADAASAATVGGAAVAADSDSDSAGDGGAAAGGAGTTHAESGDAAVASTSAQWHAHGVWSTAFTPDGSLLLSGGEEAVLVVWQLPSAGTAPGAFGGPVSDGRHMSFLPRLGAPIRAVSAYTAATERAGEGGVAAPAAAAASGGGAVSDAPPLIFAASLIDNSVVVFDGVSLRELWRVRGVAVAGLPAVVPRGVALSLRRYAARAAAKAGLAIADGVAPGASGGSARVAALASAAAAPLLLPGDYGTLLAAGARYLRRGVVVDPRTGCVTYEGRRGSVTVVSGPLGRGAHARFSFRFRRVSLIIPRPPRAPC